MEVSSPLRWLGALAVMFVVVLIVVPLLLQTVGDAVVIGGEPTDESSSEIASAPPEAVAVDAASEESPDEPSAEETDSEFPATYTVVPGDTGTKISEQFYDSPDGWNAIAEVNDIDPSAPLRVGVELTIPPPE